MVHDLDHVSQIARTMAKVYAEATGPGARICRSCETGSDSGFKKKARSNKSLDASGGGVFLNLLGAAEGALIRAAASTQTLGV